MIAKEKLEKEFRNDLHELLKKYNAEIGLRQRGRPYMQYEVIEVSISSIYDKGTLEMITPCVDFDL